MMKPLAPALAVLLAATALPVQAGDTLLIDRAQVAPESSLPRRGSSMAEVEARFGAPLQRYAPVGGGSKRTPPITRWSYANFTVYFEHSHVVDAVLNKASPLEVGPAPAGG